jgi:hypothetical protein
MKIGFTGTRAGLSEQQQRVLRSQLLAAKSCRNHPWEFLHGACLGADEQAAGLARALGYVLIDYPSDLPHLRTRLISDETHSPRRPLARNDDIIRDCDRLYACPKEDKEPRPAPGQGTWTTVRHARKAGRRTIIIWPSGMMETTCEGLET